MAGDERLRRTAAWTAPGVRLDRFMAAGADARLRGRRRASRARPGCRACRCGRPTSRGDAELVRLAEGVADGIRSTVALPLRAAGVPVGVVVLVSRTAARARAGPRAPARGDRRPRHPVPAAAARPRAAPPSRPRTSRRCPPSPTSWRPRSDLYGARMTLTPRGARRHRRRRRSSCWEPTASGEELEVTAATGAALQGMTVPLGERSVLGDAFHTGELDLRLRRRRRPARRASAGTSCTSAALRRLGARHPGRPLASACCS